MLHGRVVRTLPDRERVGPAPVEALIRAAMAVRTRAERVALHTREASIPIPQQATAIESTSRKVFSLFKTVTSPRSILHDDLPGLHP
jgi:hypothetical protein